MFCIQCGNKLPDDAAFCNSCGASTKPSKPSSMTRPSPSNPGRQTIQFDNSPWDVSMEETFNVSGAQFGPAQLSNNPGNPPWPPTQTRPNEPLSDPQLPPTQRASSPYNSNPQWLPPQGPLDGYRNTGQFPPAQTGPHPYISNPNLPQMQSGTYQQQSNPGIPPTQFGSPPIQFGSNLRNPQIPPTQFNETPAISGATHYSSEPYTQPWQTPTTGAPPPPPGAFQQRLMRMVGTNLASNAFFGVTLGGVFAAVIGVLTSIIVISIAHAIAPHVSLSNTSSLSGEDIIDSALGIVPLHNAFRDGLQFFLVMNGIGLHTQYSNDVYSFTAPLNGFIVIPAIMLTLGGYIAAGTDVQNRVHSSLWRGISIAIPYTILLFLMTTQTNGCIPAPGVTVTGTTLCSAITTNIAQLNMDTNTLLLFGVLWGALFGMLGASIKLARGQWRHVFQQYLSLNQRPRIVGSLVGGLIAIGIGSILAFLLVACTIAYTSYSLDILGRVPNNISTLFGTDWATLTLWAMAQGPLYAMNVFFFSMNAPLSVTTTTHVSISLFGSTPQISPWFRCLLALPAISLFLGGRASAAIGKAKDAGTGAIQGALITIPFTILIMLLTLLTTITTSFVPGSGGSGTGYAVSLGTAPFDVFVWALLSGAVAGALGGTFQMSTLNTGLRKAFVPLAGVLKGLSRPGYALARRLSKQRGTIEHTSTKDWLFSTGFVALILLISAAIVGSLLIGLNQTLTLDSNTRIREIAAVVLIAIPGLLLLCTCASALRRNPSGSSAGHVSVTARPTSMPMPPYQQFPQYQQYQQYPPR